MRPDERTRAEQAGVMRPRLPAILSPAMLPALLTVIVSGLYLKDAISDPTGRQIAVARIALWFLIAITALVLLFFWNRERTLSRHVSERLRARYAPDLAGNEMEEWDVTLIDAMEVEDISGEGPQFYVELEDGRVMFLGGLYLTEHVTAQRFPNRTLHITRLPHSGKPFELYCRGDYLAPTYRRSTFHAEEYDADIVPNDGEILPGPLANYKFDPDEQADERADDGEQTA